MSLVRNSVNLLVSLKSTLVLEQYQSAQEPCAACLTRTITPPFPAVHVDDEMIIQDNSPSGVTCS